MRWWVGLATGVVGLIGIGVVLFDVPAPWRLDLLVGGIAFAWLLLVVTLPWDLHFQATNVLRELDRSAARGLQPQVDRRSVQRIARRTLLASLALHLGSAAAVAIAAWWWSRWESGAWLALVYLASSVLRPIGAWYRHVREDLRRSLGEVTHPRQDVIELRSRVEHLEYLHQRVSELEAHNAALAAELRAEDHRLDRRLDQVGRRFEETLEHLTDNRELLAGIRAFLRMIREPTPNAGPGSG